MYIHYYYSSVYYNVNIFLIIMQGFYSTDKLKLLGKDKFRVGARGLGCGVWRFGFKLLEVQGLGFRVRSLESMTSGF